MYPHWSYENAWDPHSDAFFKDAVYEAPVPTLPLEYHPSREQRWLHAIPRLKRARHTCRTAPRSWANLAFKSGHGAVVRRPTAVASSPSAIDGLPPLPVPRRHSTSELRSAMPLSSAAFERIYARQFNRARVRST